MNLWYIPTCSDSNLYIAAICLKCSGLSLYCAEPDQTLFFAPGETFLQKPSFAPMWLS